MTPYSPWVWGTLVLLGVIYEFITLFNREPGDTFSEQWWRLGASHALLRFLLSGFVFWFGFHVATLGKYAGWISFLASMGLVVCLYVLWTQVLGHK